MKKNIFYTFILLMCMGCFDKNNLPNGILEKEKMQAVLWDVMKANAYTNAYIVKDSTKIAAIENAKMQLQIFELHKTTRDAFYRSYAYYTSHIEKMHPLIISLTLKAQSEKISMPADVPKDTFSIRNKPHEKDIQ